MRFMPHNPLKPCPFCGNQYAFAEYSYHDARWQHKFSGRVLCPECLASISTDDFYDTDKEALEAVIKRWNRRVSNGNVND